MQQVTQSADRPAYMFLHRSIGEYSVLLLLLRLLLQLGLLSVYYLLDTFIYKNTHKHTCNAKTRAQRTHTLTILHAYDCICVCVAAFSACVWVCAHCIYDLEMKKEETKTKSKTTNSADCCYYCYYNSLKWISAKFNHILNTKY